MEEHKNGSTDPKPVEAELPQLALQSENTAAEAEISTPPSAVSAKTLPSAEAVVHKGVELIPEIVAQAEHVSNLTKAKPAASSETTKSTVERLSELFGILDIKKAYYVDDYNNIDYFPTVAAYTKTLFLDDEKDKLTVVYGEQLNLNVPDEEVLGEALNKLWEAIEPESQKGIVAKIHEVQEIEFNRKDFERTRELQEHFPVGSLTCISPDEWNDLLNNLSANPDEKVLILFDQDLSNAQEDRFKNGTVKGQHLILEVKALDIKDNVYCALITHIITSTSEELAERDKIINDTGKKLTKNDFLALTKERISNPELLCDGIKKTLLNGYFEIIKEKSMAIMETARGNTSIALEKLDTYDFDTTILRSSYSEGVWEANTIFRITDNLYEDEVKKLMIKGNYAKEINPILKTSKKISDVKFTIDPGTSPYKEKYKLRHHDIYTLGDQLNPLYSPIENGDIFQVTEGTGIGYYALIGQECDLMMRTKPMGGRSSNIVATLAKIKVLSAEDLKKAITSGPNHFYANKFKLEYFKIGTTDVGLISFLETFSVNLDVLDLCVFQKDGKAVLDLSKTFDVDLVSSAWEGRYQKLIKYYTKESATLDTLIGELAKVTKAQGKQIKTKLLPKLCYTENLGKVNCYENKKFDFGIKRVMHLKPLGATYLLDRYYKHLSRIAEPHDFAVAI